MPWLDAERLASNPSVVAGPAWLPLKQDRHHGGGDRCRECAPSPLTDQALRKMLRMRKYSYDEIPWYESEWFFALFVFGGAILASWVTWQLIAWTVPN